MAARHFTRIVVLLFLAQPVFASELSISVVKNNSIWGGKGSWDQTAQPGRLSRHGHGSAVDFSFATDGVPWLRHSFSGRYMSGSSAKNGNYMSDYCYHNGITTGGNVSNETHGIPECDFRYTIRSIKTSTAAISYALMPTWQIDKDWSVGVGYGASLFWYKTRIESGENHVFPVGTRTTYENLSLSHYGEIRLQYKALFVSYWDARYEDGPESPDIGNRGYKAGVAFAFGGKTR